MMESEKNSPLQNLETQTLEKLQKAQGQSKSFARIRRSRSVRGYWGILLILLFLVGLDFALYYLWGWLGNEGLLTSLATAVILGCLILAGGITLFVFFVYLFILLSPNPKKDQDGFETYEKELSPLLLPLVLGSPNRQVQIKQQPESTSFFEATIHLRNQLAEIKNNKTRTDIRLNSNLPNTLRVLILSSNFLNKVPNISSLREVKHEKSAPKYKIYTSDLLAFHSHFTDAILDYYISIMQEVQNSVYIDFQQGKLHLNIVHPKTFLEIEDLSRSPRYHYNVYKTQTKSIRAALDLLEQRPT